MVLAHSLRDHGTKAKLVVLVTQDSLNPSTIDELKVSIVLLDWRERGSASKGHC